MKIKVLTIYIILLIVVVGIVWDFYAIAVGGTEASISHIVKVWGHKYPIIPFVVGVLCGHLFWGVKFTKSIKIIDGMQKELDKE